MPKIEWKNWEYHWRQVRPQIESFIILYFIPYLYCQVSKLHCKNKRVTLIQLGVSQLQVHYQKMCIQADQLHYLPNIYNTFMALIIEEIHTAKPKRLL